MVVGLRRCLRLIPVNGPGQKCLAVLRVVRGACHVVGGNEREPPARGPACGGQVVRISAVTKPCHQEGGLQVVKRVTVHGASRSLHEGVGDDVDRAVEGPRIGRDAPEPHQRVGQVPLEGDLMEVAGIGHPDRVFQVADGLRHQHSVPGQLRGATHDDTTVVRQEGAEPGETAPCDGLPKDLLCRTEVLRAIREAHDVGVVGQGRAPRGRVGGGGLRGLARVEQRLAQECGVTGRLVLEPFDIAECGGQSHPVVGGQRLGGGRCDRPLGVGDGGRQLVLVAGGEIQLHSRHGEGVQSLPVERGKRRRRFRRVLEEAHRIPKDRRILRLEALSAPYIGMEVQMETVVLVARHLDGQRLARQPLGHGEVGRQRRVELVEENLREVVLHVSAAPRLSGDRQSESLLQGVVRPSEIIETAPQFVP